MQTFDTLDLPNRAADLIREAEAGALSIVTQGGHPIFVAVPFDDILLREGVTTALAMHLFDQETLTLGQAAGIAGMGIADFMEHLARSGIPVARPEAGELEQELANFG